MVYWGGIFGGGCYNCSNLLLQQYCHTIWYWKKSLWCIFTYMCLVFVSYLLDLWSYFPLVKFCMCASIVYHGLQEISVKAGLVWQLCQLITLMAALLYCIDHSFLAFSHFDLNLVTLLKSARNLVSFQSDLCGKCYTYIMLYWENASNLIESVCTLNW